MNESFKLDLQEHNRVYAKIEQIAFRKSRPVKNPKVIILGGQPGSGKSKLLTDSKKDFPDRNVVVINGDDLREYHSRAEEIWKLDDKQFAERTDPDSRVWTKKLFDRAIETRRNIIFESTMREAGPIFETMQRLRNKGYHITAKVVATHERMSTTGVFFRYEEQKAEKGYGRFSALSSHDAGYVGMPKTVEHIESNKLADRIEVYDRPGRLLYRNELKQDRWQKAPEAVKVIEAERRREPSDKERQQFSADWERIFKLMEDRKATPDEIEHAKKVHEILDLKLRA